MEHAAKNPGDQDDQNNVLPVVNRVLEMDLLQDMILDYAIHDNDNDMVKSCDVMNCRLVNKKWLGSIYRIFRKSESPLFCFELYHERLEEGTEEPQHPSDIVQFMRSLTGNPHPEVLPYAITTSNENHQPRSLFTFLTNRCSGLVQLSVRISARQPLYPDNINFFLPRLSKFTVHIYGDYSNGRHNDIDMTDKMYFIQSVFQASQQLKSFALHSGLYDNIVPNDFGNLPLPSSIIYLEFNSKLNDHQLQVLLNNRLPRLKTLKLVASTPPYKDGLISSILLKLAKTLETLFVKYATCTHTVETTTTFQPALMEKLKNLYINTPLFELEGGRSNLQQLLPALTQVTLCLQTMSMLQKWTHGSCFPSVSFLKVSMVSIDETLHQFANIDVSTMQALHMAFPNAKELNITQFETEMTALVYIMREMTNLRCLRILADYYRRLDSSNIWDAVLIGIPEWKIGALRESPDLWEDLQDGNNVSIRNLIDLETLELDCIIKSEFAGISEIAFHYAFLKMSKLANLILKGGFWTTRKMAHEWKREGRTIETDFDERDRASGVNDD